jgi:ABC-2 type transport system ATP-binding protein
LSRDAWIRLDGVNLRRGGRPVLRDVSAELSGRAIGLVGANGAGKSTLIGALLGVLKPTSGSVSVMGLPVPAAAMEVRARCGVMAEQAGVFPGGSGVDAVAFAGTLSGLGQLEALRRAHRALDALAGGEERYRGTKEYSTGMRQRCKLAMSLVHDPEMLILDEPTVGLDPPGRAQLLRLIRDLRDEGRHVLVSTHIMQDAEFLCDSLLLLENGAVAYSGPVHGLTDDGVTVVSASGEGMDESFAEALRAGGYRIVESGAARVTFEAMGDRDLRAFWRVAAGRGVEVRSLGRVLPSLEDAVVRRMEDARVG